MSTSIAASWSSSLSQFSTDGVKAMFGMLRGPNMPVREHHARVRKEDERIAGLLTGTEIGEADLAPAEPDGHLAVERDVGQDELDLARIEAAALEEIAAPGDLLRLHLLHEARGFLLRDERGAQRLERRVAEMMVAVEMAVDHPFDRLVGELADAIDEILAIARVLARVDHQHALIGREDDRIRRGEFEQEVKVGRDLPERHLGRGRRLGRRGRAGEKNAGEHQCDALEASDRNRFHIASSHCRPRLADGLVSSPRTRPPYRRLAARALRT